MEEFVCHDVISAVQQVLDYQGFNHSDHYNTGIDKKNPVLYLHDFFIPIILLAKMGFLECHHITVGLKDT